MRQKTFYCNNCGEKIEDTEKSRADGGRFCSVCRSDFPLQAYGSKILFSAALLIGLFGIGSFWRSGEKPLNVSAKQIASSTPNQSNPPANQNSRTGINMNVQPPVQSNVSQNSPQMPARTEVKQNIDAPASNGEATYFCGAMTKKGTPCSRRVKGGGRCWQHEGQTAMLPPEKLLVKQ